MQLGLLDIEKIIDINIKKKDILIFLKNEHFYEIIYQIEEKQLNCLVNKDLLL